MANTILSKIPLPNMLRHEESMPETI